MNYELAKQLKKAGFPIEDKMFLISRNDNEIHKIGTWFPSLSELIEACDDNILYLHKIIAVNDKDNFRWIAFDRRLNGMYGSTPEEAVANLWLELNKK
jgi:hypothetical protein